MTTVGKDCRWPNLFIGGAARAGTTTLYESLKNHGDIFFPENKEPHYFSALKSHPILKVVKDEAEYLALYAPAGDTKVLGDATPGYLPDKSASERIHAVSPDPRFVFVLRDPVERAYSHYRLDYASGLAEHDSFLKALQSEVPLLPDTPAGLTVYIREGLYARHLSRFLETFGSAKVRVYLQEDLRDDLRGVFEDICRFLDVPFGDGEFIEAEGTFNAAVQPRSRVALGILRSEKLRRISRLVFPQALRQTLRGRVLLRSGRNPPMDPEARELLGSIYRDDVLQLQEMIGRDLTGWIKGWDSEQTAVRRA
jgi:hypothetical protein